MHGTYNALSSFLGQFYFVLLVIPNPDYLFYYTLIVIFMVLTVLLLFFVLFPPANFVVTECCVGVM